MGRTKSFSDSCKLKKRPARLLWILIFREIRHLERESPGGLFSSHELFSRGAGGNGSIPGRWYTHACDDENGQGDRQLGTAGACKAHGVYRLLLLRDTHAGAYGQANRTIEGKMNADTSSRMLPYTSENNTRHLSHSYPVWFGHLLFLTTGMARVTFLPPAMGQFIDKTFSTRPC